MKKLIYISLLIFLYSCGGQSIVHSDKLVIGEQWSYDNLLVSTYEAKDTTNRYDLALRINHNKEYDYQNVYLQVETIFPDGKKSKNPLSLDLANKMGTWLGNCSSNDCEIIFSFQDNFRFKSVGKHQFSIGQFSREDQLKGISEIELILFKSEVAEK